MMRCGIDKLLPPAILGKRGSTLRMCQVEPVEYSHVAPDLFSGDYEYQFWPKLRDIFPDYPPSWASHRMASAVGVAYPASEDIKPPYAQR